MLAKIQLTILEQVAKKPERRKQFYLYVDEFQHFATQSFVEILSEARKYGLNLIVAQQSTPQQSDHKLTEALLANVGTLITFRTESPADSDLLAPLFDLFIKKQDLMNIPAYNFYIKSNIIDVTPPVSCITRLLNEQQSQKLSREVAQSSRRKFCKQVFQR